MADVFNPALPPQVGAAGRKTFLMEKLRFGDGYQQVVGKGINNTEQNWPLTWKGTESEITPIKNFFDSHVAMSFFWTPPLSGQRRFLIEGYEIIPEGNGNYTLNAALMETFAP